ncbi:MAG: rhomboid family intramembrane serine protease [Acidimicrobiales bacterium]
MIPISDDNPTRRRPFMTLLVGLACVVMFFYVQPSGTRSLDLATEGERLEEIEFSYEFAAIPCELTEDRSLTAQEISATVVGGNTEACLEYAPADGVVPFPDKNVWLAAIVSMFLHAGWIHLIGNMLFLWIFGNNVEDQMGRIPFVLFYLVSGAVATAAHVMVQPSSTVPFVGASGAIAGLMGAYLVWFPWVRVRTVILLGVVPLWPRIPAAPILLAWFGSQFLIGNESSIAWMAHVAGFAFGIMAGLIARSDGDFERSLQLQHRRIRAAASNRNARRLAE